MALPVAASLCTTTPLATDFQFTPAGLHSPETTRRRSVPDPLPGTPANDANEQAPTVPWTFIVVQLVPSHEYSITPAAVPIQKKSTPESVGDAGNVARISSPAVLEIAQHVSGLGTVA
jgi:hypothetical protein